MLLFSIFQSKNLRYVLLFLALTAIELVKTETNASSKMESDKTPAAVPEQKSVKKELKVSITDEDIAQITPANEKDDHTEKVFIIDENSVIEKSGKVLEQQTLKKSSEKHNIIENQTKEASLQPQHYQHHTDKEFILNDEDSVSESLKTGFYFFLILSSGAIVFILFKIYRLRLSRAERKYGVQGDRTAQELTPLPTSVEDGHSDEEDQTLFDIQHQNMRL